MNRDAEQDIVARLVEDLQRHYSVDPQYARVVRSPYRICPLGAHIDHQLGRVTAMAIDHAVHFAYAPSATPEVRLRSLSFNGEVRFELNDVPPKRAGDWGNYPRGAVTALRKHHPLKWGLVGVTAGTLAEGGLSSSAAAGVAYLLAFEDVNGLEISPWENIELDRMIENEYLGLRNGILDQSAILLSQKDSLAVIDCKTTSHTLVPRAAMMQPFAILVAFSGVRQSLVTTGYNLRVAECAEAAHILLKAAGRAYEQPLLGNVTLEEYLAHHTKLSAAPAHRARHFFTEMERVREGIEAWREGYLVRFGQLVSESGRSSVENYECGSPPLIDLYEILIATEGVYGARFSGAGFRGCCMAFVEPERAEVIAAVVREKYAARHPELVRGAPVLICHPDDGARIL